MVKFTRVIGDFRDMDKAFNQQLSYIGTRPEFKDQKLSPIPGFLKIKITILVLSKDS